jgi:hypothetical protein
MRETTEFPWDYCGFDSASQQGIIIFPAVLLLTARRRISF